MKKIVLSIALLTTALLATSGADIYDKKCAVCHKMQGVMDKSQMQSMRAKMQSVSQEEKMAMKE